MADTKFDQGLAFLTDRAELQRQIDWRAHVRGFNVEATAHDVDMLTSLRSTNKPGAEQ